MKPNDVVRILNEHKNELTERFGVKSLALFGSVVRDEATEASDIDLLVDFNRPVGLFGLFALQDYREELLGCPVDLGTRDSLKPRIRSRVLAECVDVA